MTRPRMLAVAASVAVVIVALVALVAAVFPAHADEVTPTPPPPARPTVAVVGDSYTAGFGSTQGQPTAWYQETARDLGWQVGNVIADPGGGYVQPGWFGTIPQAVAAHPIPSWTDYVLLQVGLNDTGPAISNPDSIIPAEAQTIAELHQQAPGAQIIVVGALDPNPRAVNPAFYDAARVIGDARAVGGNRYMIAEMCSYEVGPDGTHPTDLGHRQIGQWVAWHAAHGLDAGTPLSFNGTSWVA